MGLGLLEDSFVALQGYAEQADDAAGGDQARGVERARRDVALVRAAGALGGRVDQPADNAAGEDGQRGSDGEIRAHGERERADAEQLDGDDQEDAEHDQSPGQLAAEDAVDDRGHQVRLGRGGASRCRCRRSSAPQCGRSRASRDICRWPAPTSRGR